MVIIAQQASIQQKIASKKIFFCSISFGIFCLFIPIVCLTNDPLLLLARTKLKIVKGGLIHEILNMEVKGLYVMVYVFNITNAEQFSSGEDHKLKLQAVGPFVYQEYRVYEDLEILDEKGIMRLTPKIRTVFIPEDSIGDPNEIILNLPNVPLMSLTSILSSYPFILKTMYNLITLQQNAQPIIQKDVHSFLWNYTDPSITALNKIAPGLVYYDSIGILDRLYDNKIVYRMELGATDEDKFQIKWVHKKMSNNLNSAVETNITYKDTYQGDGYPPDLPPEASRHFYRQGICKTLEAEYIGKVMLNLSTEGQVFDFSRRAFENTYFCDSEGYCPYGMKDLSECYFGTPITISRGHFTDADPKLFERIEGMNPDPETHGTYIHIEPKIGLIIKGKTSLQLNMVLKNIEYSTMLCKFNDLVLPMLQVTVHSPPLPDIIQSKLELLFLTAYKVMLVLEIVSAIIGVILLARSARMLYWMWTFDERAVVFEQVPNPKTNFDVVY